MEENADFAKLESIERRKSGGENLYLRLYRAKMAQNPGAHRFSDPSLDQTEREALTRWNRDCDDRTSPLNLQLLFAFSVPSREALDFIVGLNRRVVSVGAGVGYWEFLLQQRGCDVLAFDSNELYPEGLHYIDVKKGGPEVLTSHGDRALFLTWPDSDESSTLSTDCLNHYNGDVIIHVGELFGETLSSDPWGQSTSKAFQLDLGERFRCVTRMQLPNWPGHADTLTLWRRIPPAVDCYGAMFHYVDLPQKRYWSDFSA
ncbi:Hypp328 [Branchiostoma lanceolatum]|uniref:Hypp328 protein n=1 Tax=Branchiostoma lanceolatum TaxID=7740 RepID=A0A8J9YIT4_BRALA|nr:Hypp328 [Branchiostoma lanceolatum]